MARTQYFHAPKLAVVGVGFVGSSFAYSLVIHGTVAEIVLIDVDRKSAEGEAMDDLRKADRSLLTEIFF